MTYVVADHAVVDHLLLVVFGREAALEPRTAAEVGPSAQSLIRINPASSPCPVYQAVITIVLPSTRTLRPGSRCSSQRLLGSE